MRSHCADVLSNCVAVSEKPQGVALDICTKFHLRFDAIAAKSVCDVLWRKKRMYLLFNSVLCYSTKP